MIENCVRIIDRLIQLLAVRAKRRSRLFEELWEPTFADLREVHQDYLGMFTSCSAEISQLATEGGGVDFHTRLRKVADELRRRRLEFEPVRRQLVALINQSRTLDLDNRSDAFVQALIWYFPTGTNRSLPTWASETLTRLDAMLESVDCQENAAHLDSGSLGDIQGHVAKIIRYQREAWDRVCDAYAELKTQHASETVL